MDEAYSVGVQVGFVAAVLFDLLYDVLKKKGLGDLISFTVAILSSAAVAILAYWVFYLFSIN